MPRWTARPAVRYALFLTVLTIFGFQSKAETLQGVPGVAASKADIVLGSFFSPPVPAGATLSARSQRPVRAHAGLRAALAHLQNPGLQARDNALLPSGSFLALPDNDTTVPPDTDGAVGPDRLMTALNSQILIQNKDGTNVGIETLDTFWGALHSGVSPFDPRVIFDSLSQRWIFSSMANPVNPQSALMIAVSDSTSPEGNWHAFYIPADPSGKGWIDFDNIGVNKDWIVLGATLVDIKTGRFTSFNYYVFDKNDLLGGGAGKYTLFKESYPAISNERLIAPAITTDPALAVEYIVENSSNHNGTIRVSTVTGAVGAETLTTGTAFPLSTDPWSDSTPQTDLGPQAGSIVGIDTNDSLVHRCVYRNGSLWCAQSIFLPPVTPTRASVQWWQFTPDGTVQQRGRIDDPTGINMYGFPSIAVNKNNDLLLGYTRFSKTQFASACCSYRLATDAPNTLQPEMVLKSGEVPYVVTPDPNDNRWGDYSAACVDPADDVGLWTIQEYAANGGNGIDSWGTWWGYYFPIANTTSGVSIVPDPAAAGRPVTFSIGLPPSASMTWHFGDGTSQAGSVVTHTYAAPGEYSITAEVNATNELHADLEVFADVNNNGVPDIAEIDGDGDGFPDAIEVLAGSDPANPNSTPVNNLPAVAGTLTLTRVNVRFDLRNKVGTLALSGTLPAPVPLSGQVVYVEILGLAEKFTLDTRGQANVSRTDFFRIASSGRFTASVAVNLLQNKQKLNHQGFIQTVKLTRQPEDVPVQILIAGQVCAATRTIKYTVTPGRTATGQ